MSVFDEIPTLSEKEWTKDEYKAAMAFLDACGNDFSIFSHGNTGNFMYCIRAALMAITPK